MKFEVSKCNIHYIFTPKSRTIKKFENYYLFFYLRLLFNFCNLESLVNDHCFTFVRVFFFVFASTLAVIKDFQCFSIWKRDELQFILHKGRCTLRPMENKISFCYSHQIGDANWRPSINESVETVIFVYFCTFHLFHLSLPLRHCMYDVLTFKMGSFLCGNINRQSGARRKMYVFLWGKQCSTEYVLYVDNG